MFFVPSSSTYISSNLSSFMSTSLRKHTNLLTTINPKKYIKKLALKLFDNGDSSHWLSPLPWSFKLPLEQTIVKKYQKRMATYMLHLMWLTMRYGNALPPQFVMTFFYTHKVNNLGSSTIARLRLINVVIIVSNNNWCFVVINVANVITNACCYKVVDVASSNY